MLFRNSIVFLCIFSSCSHLTYSDGIRKCAIENSHLTNLEISIENVIVIQNSRNVVINIAPWVFFIDKVKVSIHCKKNKS